RLHPGGGPVGRRRRGRRAGAAHRGRVAGEKHPSLRHRHRRARRACGPADNGDRVRVSRPHHHRPADRRGSPRTLVVADARAASAWRRWGYRVLPGDLFSYLLHLRPAEWPIMAAHTALGWVLAVGVRGALQGAHAGAALAARVLWVVLLNGGTLTPFATWAATGRPLDTGHGLVLLAFCPLFAALYPLTQLYQFEEDRRRGDRTLALIVGMRKSLVIAIVCALLAFALFAAAVVVLGIGMGWGVLLAVPFAAWLLVLGPWYARHESWSPAEHQRGMYRALTAWALTDLAVLAVFAR